MTLLVCAGREAAEAVLPGARILAWDDAAAQALASARVPCDTVRGLVGDGARAEADAAVASWTKALGKRPLLEGRSFRELVSWKGVPLWCFAEAYLHDSTATPARVRAIELFHRVLESAAPREVEAAGLAPAEMLLLQRTCTARGILCHGDPKPPGSSSSVLRASLECRWRNAKTALAAVRGVFSTPPKLPPRDGRKRVLVLCEHDLDALRLAVAAEPKLEPFVFASRATPWRVAQEVLDATRQLRALWRSLRESPAAQEAFSHLGITFFDLAQRDLAATLLLELPEALRNCAEIGAALEATEPSLVLLCAESSGRGRAAVAACRARGVPSLALHHGPLDPGAGSYLGPHEPDCPRPDRTAVLDDAAKRFLVEQGRYAPESVIVTGRDVSQTLALLRDGLASARLSTGPC